MLMLAPWMKGNADAGTLMKVILMLALGLQINANADTLAEG